jgi:Protein of unknown function (DUF3306)
MNEKPEGRLARWSRLKRAQCDKGNSGPGIAPGQPAVVAGASSSRELSRPSVEEAPPPATTAPELPPLTELNKDSDFTPFLRAGVPEGVHREALRALWRSDPVFAFRDGLTDYDEDYTAIGMVEQVVRTAYQAGQGYLRETEVAPPTYGRVDEEGEPVAAVSPASSVSEGPPVEATPTDAADRPADEASRGPAESSPTSPVVRNGC